jgi:hypothetical protein
VKNQSLPSPVKRMNHLPRAISTTGEWTTSSCLPSDPMLRQRRVFAAISCVICCHVLLLCFVLR